MITTIILQFSGSYYVSIMYLLCHQQATSHQTMHHFLRIVGVISALIIIAFSYDISIFQWKINVDWINLGKLIIDIILFIMIWWYDAKVIYSYYCSTNFEMLMVIFFLRIFSLVTIEKIQNIYTYSMTIC